MFVEITHENYPLVAEIFSFGIQYGKASFRTEPPSWDVWNSGHMSIGRIAFMKDGKMAGWGALSQKPDLCAYEGVAEVSVYIHPDYRRRGIGVQILNELISISEHHGLWTLESRIMADNPASIALHEKCGFRVVGRREKIGRWKGQWKDCIFMERRSKVVGI